MTAVLTGPVLLPDGTPMAGAQVKVELVSGNARSVGHVYENGGSARVAPAPTEVDADGNFTVEVPTLAEENVYPPSSYYTVTVGGGRWPKFTRKIKPINDSTYVISDPTIGGETEDLLPPDFVQMVPDLTTEDIDLAVAAYLAANPVDVETEVAAALAADPPLLVSNNGSDIVDDDGFRLAIGAAADSEMEAADNALSGRIGAIETENAAAPPVRAPGYESVRFFITDGGWPAFEVEGDGEGGAGGGSVPPGGDTGQVLSKASDDDFDTEWSDVSGGGGAVDSVDGQTGVVDLSTVYQPLDSDLTSWAAKTAPAGAAVGTTDSQTLTNKTLTAPVVNSPTGIVKGDVGLGNVDNTSDANKPVSTAQQTALDGKQTLDADLTAVAGLSPSNDDVLQRKSGAWANRTIAQLKTDLAYGTAASADTGTASGNVPVLNASGFLPVARLGSTPSATTYLRGDQGWTEISSIVATDTTGVTVVSSTAETDVASFTLPAIATVGDIARVVMPCSFINSSGAGVTFEWRAKFGTTTVSDTTAVSLASNAGRWYGNICFDITLTGASSETTMFTGSFSRGGVFTTSAVSGFAVNGTAAESVATSKAVKVTVQLGTSSASADFIAYSSTLELWKRRS